MKEMLLKSAACDSSLFVLHFGYSAVSTDLIDLLAPWSRVLEKLPFSQLVKKFSTFYGTRIFITALTSACYLSLS